MLRTPVKPNAVLNTQAIMAKKYFSGEIVDGIGLLSLKGNDSVPNLAYVRNWAYEKGLIFDDDQVMTDRRAIEILDNFDEEDEVWLLGHVSEDERGLMYLEYPYIPLKTIIKKSLLVRLVWWEMQTIGNDKNDHGLLYNRLRFGFWIPDSVEEFICFSSSKGVCERFFDKFNELSPEYGGRTKKRKICVSSATGESKESYEEYIEINVNGNISANFF